MKLTKKTEQAIFDMLQVIEHDPVKYIHHFDTGFYTIKNTCFRFKERKDDHIENALDKFDMYVYTSRRFEWLDIDKEKLYELLSSIVGKYKDELGIVDDPKVEELVTKALQDFSVLRGEE